MRFETESTVPQEKNGFSKEHSICCFSPSEIQGFIFSFNSELRMQTLYNISELENITIRWKVKTCHKLQRVNLSKINRNVSEYKPVLQNTKIFLFGKRVFHNEQQLLYTGFQFPTYLVYVGSSCANGAFQIMRQFLTERRSRIPIQTTCTCIFTSSF